VEVARYRPDALPVLDGDAQGDSYLTALRSGSPAPARVVRYGKEAAVECLSAWVLEPALASPGPVMKELLGASTRTIRKLQDALIGQKKARELHENIVWESIACNACCERACEFLQDLAAIASDGSPANPGWAVLETDGTVVYVASHIARAQP